MGTLVARFFEHENQGAYTVWLNQPVQSSALPSSPVARSLRCACYSVSPLWFLFPFYKSKHCCSTMLCILPQYFESQSNIITFPCFCIRRCQFGYCLTNRQPTMSGPHDERLPFALQSITTISSEFLPDCEHDAPSCSIFTLVYQEVAIHAGRR